jgi:type II secretory pathway pseudopilin PulG
MFPRARRSRAFTTIELLLVLAVIAVLAALLFPVLSAARKQAAVTRCSSDLRQIGMAYSLYLEDYGAYPRPQQLTHSVYLRDPAILYCPEDDTLTTRRTASSYVFRSILPPDFRPLAGRVEVPGSTVLVSCRHHLGLKTGIRLDPRPPSYPYRLGLRASGTVSRIRWDEVQTVPVPGEASPTFTSVYPGEPWYEGKS